MTRIKPIETPEQYAQRLAERLHPAWPDLDSDELADARAKTAAWAISILEGVEQLQAEAALEEWKRRMLEGLPDHMGNGSPFRRPANRTH